MSQSNITVDDTATILFYGPGWGISSSDDPALSEYFQSTYHASQTSGAAVNLTYSGSAVYLYGSKGPDHGNFSVRYDSLIQFLSARADTQEYQQLLFSAQLPLGTHSLTLTNTDTSQRWLDLDFVTVTSGSGNTSSTTVGFSSTISPPALPTSSSISEPSPSSSQGGATAQTSSASTSNTVTLILAIVFGILLLCLCIGVSLYLIRRHRRRQNEPSHVSPDVHSTQGPQSMRSAGSAFLGPQSVVLPSPPAPQTGFEASSPAFSASAQSHSTSNVIPVNTFSERGSDVEMRQWGHSTPQAAQGTLPTARPWSPFGGPLKHLFGVAKDGADSMKSTFLKV